MLPFRIPILFLGLVLALGGCDIINPAEDVPAYVRIDSFAFQNSDPGRTLGSTRQIRSVLVSYEGQTLGAFDLPANVPVPVGSGGVLTVLPGVDNSGLRDYQLFYPFYQPDTLRLRREDGGRSIAYTPATRYYDSVKFLFKEDFSFTNTFNVRLSGDTDLVQTIDPAYILYGNASGLIRLDAARPACEVTSTAVFKPVSNTPFLEIDYRSNIPFEIGVYSITQGIPGYQGGGNPNPAGAKLYIGLEAFVAAQPSSAGFRLQLKTRLPDGQSNGYVAVDNIKVVSF